jgi:hypothetical protein
MGFKNRLSPVVVFAFNRPEKLNSCLKSLELAFDSELTSVFIFIDGHRSLQEKLLVDEVESIARLHWHFGEIQIRRSPMNLGLANSILTGIDFMFESFESVIVLEDDLEVARNFLTYMNDGLLKYVYEERVCSIQGYTYPNLQQQSGCFFLRGSDCWGWATWRDRWSDFERDAKILHDDIVARELENLFDLNGEYPYLRMLKDNQLGLNDSWAVRWHASNFVKNKLSLYPPNSLVTNTGDDGNGTHAGKTTGFRVNLKNSEIGDLPEIIGESVFARSKLIKFHAKRNRKYFLSRVKAALKLRLVVSKEHG